MIIAIDFDGTICEHKFPEIGDIRKNARPIINRLYNEGHTILIWTVRSKTNDAIGKCKQWLDDNGISYHKINEDADEIANNPEWKYFSPKIYADVYIDDRQVGGIPEDWVDIYTTLCKQFPIEVANGIEKYYRDQIKNIKQESI